MGPVERLKQTRWWKPAIEKYASYVQAHRRQNCLNLKEGFTAFAADVLQMPEGKRDELLSIDSVGRSEPAVRYRQYEQPTPAEMKIGTVRKRDKGRRR